LRKLILAAAVLAAPSTNAPAIAQEPRLAEHTCRLHSDGSVTCLAATIGDCQQLIAYVRLNDSIDDLDVVQLSSHCDKIGAPRVGYRVVFELL
jgi:hypothetical protein